MQPAADEYLTMSPTVNKLEKNTELSCSPSWDNSATATWSSRQKLFISSVCLFFVLLTTTTWLETALQRKLKKKLMSCKVAFICYQTNAQTLCARDEAADNRCGVLQASTLAINVAIPNLMVARSCAVSTTPANVVNYSSVSLAGTF